jgi:hypothetical protein
MTVAPVLSRGLMIRLLPVLSFLLITACMKNVDPGAPPSASAPAPAALECRLEAEPPLAAGGPIRVRLTLTRPSGPPAYALIWNTPFESRWKGTIFSVTRDGQEIAYTGPMTKRGDPSRDEYVEIAPGRPAVATADLAQVYDLSQPGSYEVKVTQGLVDVTTEASALPRTRDRHEGTEVECVPLRLTLTGR